MLNEERNQQKELFEFERPKRHFPRFARFANIFPKADLAGKAAVNVTLEKIIFTAIGIVMLMVIVYALGVENGKSLSRKAEAISVALPSRQRANAPIDVKTMPAAQASQSGPAVPAQKNVTMEGTVIKIKTVPLKKASSNPPETAMARDARKPYTIIAVTLSSRDAALREIKNLARDGFDANLVQSRQYFQVMVGAYANKGGAGDILKKIRQKYKDAYIIPR